MTIKPKNLISRMIRMKLSDQEVYNYVVGMSYILGIGLGLSTALIIILTIK